ncbi:MAG: M20/M25/M40 family metallo-hydrolase, partial [Candidatus Thermoplasmatota archaeon]|nr:M20/M25/M40 family metallo-hydrolase [Candidatus Thermoplasmatota archaeon]
MAMKNRLTSEESDEMIELLKMLIRTPSAENDGDQIYNIVYDHLKSKGLDPEFQKVKSPYVAYGGHTNLYLKMGNGKGPKIMLNGHLDTVIASSEWFHEPYKAYEEGDKVFGLGAADMKGGCAAMIGAILALGSRMEELNGELLISFVFGEEAPFSLGTDTLLREFSMKDYDLIIIPEPSPILAINDYCTTHKRIHKASFPTPIIGAEGRILFEIELFGKSTHASHPSQGINSLEDAAKLIHKLTEFDLFSSAKMGRGHYCVLNIEGGHQAFTVPSYCKIFVN